MAKDKNFMLDEIFRNLTLNGHNGFEVNDPKHMFKQT